VSKLTFEIEETDKAMVGPNDDTNAGSFVGRQLSALCVKHAVVARGFLIWATERCRGTDFCTSAAYPTMAPGILSLARIIVKHHPFCRRAVVDLAFIFLKHSNSELSYEKLTGLKEQALRLLLWLSVQGLAMEVFSIMGHKLRERSGSEIDSALLRYFMEGALEIIRPPLSLTFARSFSEMLNTKPCVEALSSVYFDTKRKQMLIDLIGFCHTALSADKSTSSDVGFVPAVECG